MATVAINVDPFQKAIDYLETERVMITNFTNFWKDLSDHISSLERSLQQKCETLDSKLQTFDSATKETLESLATREESLPSKESDGTDRVEQLKQAALSEIEEHSGDVPKDADVVKSLRFLCRKMDASSLWRFLIARRKDLATIRAELQPAIGEAVDPASLILQALEDFVFKRGDKVGLSDQRWACGLLLRTLSNEEGVSTSVKERAWSLAQYWKEKIDGSEDGGLASNATEVQMFLQLLVAYKLVDKLETDYLKKLVVAFASRRDMPKLAICLSLKDKMGDIIEELVNNGKEIDAIYFIYESDLVSKFPPVPLLKAYLKSTRKNANGATKSGSEDDSSELNALKAMIKCIEDHNLQTQFYPESLKRRVTQLEKTKADKKRYSGPPKLPNKRSRASGGGVGSASFPPAKAGRHANAYPSSTWRDQTLPAHQHSAAYVSAYSSHDYPYLPESSTGGSRSPAAMARRPYPYMAEDVSTSHAAAVAAATPYVSAPASYTGYDYASTLPSYHAPTYLH